MSKKKAPVDFVKWLQGQLKAFCARRFEQLDVEALGDELRSVVVTYRYAVEEHAERLFRILKRPEYVYGDWNDLMYESSMLDLALRHSPSLAKTAAAQIKSAYRLARSEAELHGEGMWPAKCLWPTLEALRRAVRARYREYLTIEREVGWDPWGTMSAADRAEFARSRFHSRDLVLRFPER